MTDSELSNGASVSGHDDRVRVCRRCGEAKPAIRFRKTAGPPRATNRRVAAGLRATRDERRAICRACEKTAERRRRGAAPMAEISARAEQRRRARPAPRAPRCSLLADHPDAEWRKRYAAMLYAQRYANDSAFRQRERARQRNYKHANPQKVARWGERRKELAAALADGTLTRARVRALFAAAEICPYCAAAFSAARATLDHLDPLSRGGTHGVSNVAVCCRRCNIRKRNMPFVQWLRRLSPEHAGRARRLYIRVRGHVPEQVALWLEHPAEGAA